MGGGGGGGAGKNKQTLKNKSEWFLKKSERNSDRKKKESEKFRKKSVLVPCWPLLVDLTKWLRPQILRPQNIEILLEKKMYFVKNLLRFEVQEANL